MKTTSILKRLAQAIQREITGIEKEIANFTSPLTIEDHKNNYRSRLTGRKSVSALEVNYKRLAVLQSELMELKNYAFSQKQIRMP